MESTQSQIVESLGSLIALYRKDLAYFQEFQNYAGGAITTDRYAAKYPHSFQDFIDGYQVSRTLVKGRTLELLNICKNWYDAGRHLDVNGLAQAIVSAGIVHGRPVSLASKVMFLMRPDEVLPYDSQAKKALGMKSSETDYTRFYQLAMDFERSNRGAIDDGLCSVANMLEILEGDLKDFKLPIHHIRRRRYLDKLLWTVGNNSKEN